MSPKETAMSYLNNKSVVVKHITSPQLFINRTYKRIIRPVLYSPTYKIIIYRNLEDNTEHNILHSDFKQFYRKLTKIEQELFI